MTDSGGRTGKSPHVFMQEALDVQAKLREQRSALIVAARAAEAEALASGLGHAAADVEEYFAARTQQLSASRPVLRPWRK